MEDATFHCLGILSGKHAEQELEISSLVDDLSSEYGDTAWREGLVRGVLDFLSLVGIVSLDWDEGTYQIRSINASFGIRALREAFREDTHLIRDWHRLGVSEPLLRHGPVINSGVDFIYWLDSLRERKTDPIPLKVGHVAKAVIKRRDGSDEFLFIRNQNSGRYELIGGRRRYEDEEPAETMRRELREELREHNLHFGKRTHLEHVGDAPTSMLSPTYGCLTEWHCDYYSIRFEDFNINTPDDTRWVTLSEIKSGATDDGEPILYDESSTWDHLIKILKGAPYSKQ